MSPSALPPDPAAGGTRPLAELLRDAGLAVPEEADGAAERRGEPSPAAEVRISGVTSDSRTVGPGSLFVAVRGTRIDGHDFVDDALDRGAAAVVVEDAGAAARARQAGASAAVVPSARRALARLAAAWHGHPARRLHLAGITGTLGKTSTLSILEAVLLEARDEGDPPVASLGSLGLRVGGRTLEETGYTAPDPLLLHRQLARAAEAGSRRVVVEITSHALEQERVHGLGLDLGIFTGLVPLEHADYHGSFRSYVEAKSRFFDHLRPGAPLVYDADDRAVRRIVRGVEADPIGCGTSRTACVRAEPEEMSARGTRLSLRIRRPLPRVGGGTVATTRIPLDLRLLGRANVSNAALAATAALCLGVDPEAVRSALAAFPPPPRRMEVVHDGGPLVLDDTVGHPDSFSALFEVVEKLAPARVHVVYAVRGGRGPGINRQNARTLAAWADRIPLETLVVTRSVEAVDETDRVREEEWRAFLEALPEGRFERLERERRDDAVRDGLGRSRPDDLVLLLGAQGMDGGADTARDRLAEAAQPVP